MTIETEVELVKPDLAAVGQTVDSQALAVQSKRFRIICVLHLIAGWIAMLLAWYDVESIIGTFPALIVMGLMVTVPAMRRKSWLLLSYGLSAFGSSLSFR